MYVNEFKKKKKKKFELDSNNLYSFLKFAFN